MLTKIPVNPPNAGRRSATGLLRVLLAGSLLIPLALFAGVSWQSYCDAMVNAKRELLRSSEVAREHAAKVFDSQSQVADRVNDLIAGMDAATIQQDEKRLHNAFAAIVARLPQVQSVLLASRDGHPMVSAGVYPVPDDVSVRDSDYFKAVVNGYTGTYVSALQVGNVNRRLFFGLAEPWTAADGSVKGVIGVAVSPTFFQDFYQVLVGEGSDGAEGKAVALIRDDGQILVRYPPVIGAQIKAPANGAFATAIRANPDHGMFKGRSIVDPAAPQQILVYRKVQGYPVYVVSGLNRQGIIDGWRRTVASQMVFGVPITLALFGTTWIALVRTRRETEALARARQEFERREIAEAALLRSQRLEAVGQMTGGVAHDFNNLLMVMLAGSEMLQRRATDSSAVRDIADQINLAARRGGEITQQLLAFSRRQTVNAEVIDLNARLREFKQLLDRAAQEATRVKLDLDLSPCPVRLDPGHFEAAILNLVGNARDAMPQGGDIMITTRKRVLTAAEHPELPAGSYIRVAVADQGTGMDADAVARAFEPFFTTKGVGKGTGLGLSQVYGFAKQAAGDVRILSTFGRGTTVEIWLPHARDPVPAGRMAPEGQPGKAENGEVVLVVEDEPAVLAMAVECLHELGYATIAATNGRDALDRLEENARVDVLFSDVMMPGGMDGRHLSAEARRRRPGLRVLLTSGYSGGTDKENAGNAPVLTKPYSRVALAARLREVLQT